MQPSRLTCLTNNFRSLCRFREQFQVSGVRVNSPHTRKVLTLRTQRSVFLVTFLFALYEIVSFLVFLVLAHTYQVTPKSDYVEADDNIHLAAV